MGDILQNSSLIVTPILVAIVGMYLKQLLSKVESIDDLKNSLNLAKQQLAELSTIKPEWSQMRLEITKLIVEMEHIKKSNEDVSVIKRDMTSLWKNIDKIKDAIFDEEYGGGNQ